jgi:hypothetical protein
LGAKALILKAGSQVCGLPKYILGAKALILKAGSQYAVCQNPFWGKSSRLSGTVCGPYLVTFLSFLGLQKLISALENMKIKKNEFSTVLWSWNSFVNPNSVVRN